jgi:hypothetical protein
MFYEDVKVARGDTLWKIAEAYAYKGSEWSKIWQDPKNVGLVVKRGLPQKIEPGDDIYVPIPWEIVYQSLSQETDGASMIAERDGELGKRLAWVQTVYQHNQPIGGTLPYCVDGCPADDADPFYWTDAELLAKPERRKKFSDHSSRGAPTTAQGTTRWRAVLSLAVNTNKRVTVWNSVVWGWDMTPKNEVTIVGPRDATAAEVAGHMNLLRKGLGTGPATFMASGWTFRRPPP